MKRWRIIILGLLLVMMVFIAAVSVRFGKAEPAYQGKPVTQWIRELGLAPRTNQVSAGTGAGNIPRMMIVATVTDANGRRQLIYLQPPTTPQTSNQMKSALSLFGRQGTVTLSTNIISFPTPTTAKLAPDPALAAVQRMGEAAVPHLVGALGKHDTFVDDLHRMLWAKAPRSLVSNYLSAPFPAPQWRRNAAELLVAMKSTNAIPALTKALGDPDLTVRLHACEALGAIGRPAAAAAPALAAVLADSTSTVSSEAFAALDRIGTVPAGLPQLIRTWKKSRPPDFSFMTYAENNHLTGPVAAMMMGQMLEDASAAFRRDLLIRLRSCRGAAACAVPQIIPLLREPHKQTRLLAMQALEDIGPGAIGAEEELRRCEKDEDGDVAINATSALRRIRQPK